MINWDKYFDNIFVISGCSNFERRKWIDSEFSRVGINNFNYWYNFDGNVKIDNGKFDKNIENKHINITYAHYSLIKTSYQLGYENILICEDDICFLKDINQIYNTLEKFNDIKSKINIYLFDYYDYNKFQWMYADCYYLDRKGMEYLIYCIENYPFIHDNFLLKIFKYPNNNLDINCNYILSKNYKVNLSQPILPIQIEISDTHLCIQKWNCDFPYDFLDENLYNKYDNLIDWNKYFDHIFVLSRCSNFERREKLNQELKRIGLYDYVTYLYQPDSELLDYQSSPELSKSNYRCKYGHYSCIKMAYELNYDNICIIEDDAIFLKDINEIKNQLEIFLQNKDKSDIYLFDYIIHGLEIPLEQYYLTDFYWLNKRGMKLIIYMLETYPEMQIDSFFIKNLSDMTVKHNYTIKLTKTSNPVLIKLDNLNILPISINISPNRICIQATNYEYQNFNNNLDRSLYNL